MSDLVLVTGISGFLGGHIALKLLRQGYAVRGSVRDPGKTDKIGQALTAAGADVARLEICILDLLRDDGWRQAASGCRYLLHVASPFVLTMPKDENDLIGPAVAGTRRAMKAALDASVERAIVTSSVAAIDSGHRQYDRRLGPDDWSDLGGPHVTAYAKSKTLAEREAWASVERAGRRELLAVINPGTMIGPLLDDDPGTSVVVIQRMLRGDMPMLPELILPWVDVRDVAAAHVAAMTSSATAGKRTILTNSALPLIDVADMLRRRLGPKASRVPTRRMPKWLTSLFMLFDQSLRDGRTYLGSRRQYEMSAAPALLGRPLIPVADAVEATAVNLIERHLV